MAINLEPMKFSNIFNACSLFLVGIMIILASSCKKDDPNSGLEDPRIFKPGGISIRTTQTSATITWAEPLLSAGQPLTYTAEFSQDSTFATKELTKDTDTLGLTVSDTEIKVRSKYYVRVKANAYGDQPESKWTVSSGFGINGEQLFFPLRDLEIKETSVVFRWKPDPSISTFSLHIFDGTAAALPITAEELATGLKVVTGLQADKNYTAELFSGAKSRGYLLFKTAAATVYTTILNPEDDLAAAIGAAADHAVIGLNPGVYNTSNLGFTILQKTITLKSTSGNPADTKISFKEFSLKGSGAGIKVSGLEFDGKAAASLYFINLGGVSSDAEQAVFTQVSIENCVIHDVATSLMRADRGAAAGDYKMSQIVIKNTLFQDVAASSNYLFLHINELEFKSLTATNSTFNNIGRGMITCSTVLSSLPPAITFDYCTVNNMGANNLNVLISAGANPVKYTMTNSIIANVPRALGTVNDLAVGVTSAASFTVFSNNNTFNFTNAAGVALKFPTTNITQMGNLSIDLDWTAETTDFTLPAGSVLRTVSSAGTAIGDSRWSY